MEVMLKFGYLYLFLKKNLLFVNVKDQVIIVIIKLEVLIVLSKMCEFWGCLQILVNDVDLFLIRDKDCIQKQDGCKE